MNSIALFLFLNSLVFPSKVFAVEWTVGLTYGKNYNNHYHGQFIDIGKNAFNQLFRNNAPYIMKRECDECVDSHRIIYYKRYTKIDTFDVYSNLKSWMSTDNAISTDMNLFSSLEDAISDRNPWKYCNYDDSAVGAFRDCGPNGAVGDWQMPPRKAVRFSIYTAFMVGLTFGGENDNTYLGQQVDIGKNTFNQLFQNNPLYIIRRECAECVDSHKVIYYKRYTKIYTFDVYSNLKSWLSIDNEIYVDMNLFSTLQDALNDENAWRYCNYDAAVGAFRDCGPTGFVGNWQMPPSKATRFSIYNK